MALSANTPRTGQDGDLFNYAVAKTTIFQGGIVCANAAGYLVPGGLTATYKALGIAKDYVDNSGGSAGDLECQVESDRAFWLPNSAGNPVVQGDVGGLCYVEDDNFVRTFVPAGVNVACGRVLGLDATLGVLVYIGPPTTVSAVGTDLALSGDLSVGGDASVTGDLGVTGVATFTAEDVHDAGIEISAGQAVAGAGAMDVTAAGALGIGVSAGANDITITMGDAGGAQKVSFVDSASAEVASIDSNGVLTVAAGETITAGGLIVTAGGATVTAGDVHVTAGNLHVVAGTAQFGAMVTADVGFTATTGGVTASAGNIVADGGNIVASVGDITASAGDIVATLGNMTASAGNIAATLGNVTAGAALSGNTLAVTTTSAFTGIATFTAAADFDGGATVAAGQAITGAGAITLAATGANALTLQAGVGGNIIANLGDNGAANKISFVDLLSVEVARIDSDGNIQCDGTITPTGVIDAGAASIELWYAASDAGGANPTIAALNAAYGATGAGRNGFIAVYHNTNGGGGAPQFVYIAEGVWHYSASGGVAA